MSDEREALSAAVDSILAPKALRVLHKAIIRDQDADGNVGVVMAGVGAPSETAKPVPLWLGLPGFSARMRTSASPEVSIGFHEGSEAGAYAALFPSYPQGVRPTASLPVITLSFGSGTKPIARVDDTVANGALVFRQTPVGPAGVPSILAIFYKNALGTEIPVLTFPIPGPAVMLALDPEAPDPTTAIVPIGGKITSGRAEFLA
jgi:hypothetical protein